MLDLFQKTPYDILTYPELETLCKQCTLCDLCKTRTQVVVGHGKVPSHVMVIGEGPGEQEDLHGKPFIGKAGQLLTQIFESVGINREEETYITNVVKCRPPENRTPHPAETLACKPYLIRQIQLVQPKILILLGAPSLKTVLEESQSISKVRGQWYKVPTPYMEELLYIMPMFHPSFLLRNQSKEKGSPKWLTWQDMKEVKAALDYYKNS